ncbi:uncharacterized protein K460DRAFT_295068 [Cucurbitaria berberidis CBS 394.84]|uniref:LIM zinc-binding domain-containing protein n=1 Tax=Cucurbitaria berberidis CBS 394.84 TaxID=1168544 RepID=A0A9P4G8H6_9PLEO|nr:uncharacterized protein K460DRAFT_295068 [Cucurbitaria berberidis CBS 394.84]KAF1840852.1 hypothetical protein K460DRAFT_295068 [Cucurbitaria berberidis CBS 394.84]
MHTSKEREGASSPGPGAYYSPMQMKSYLQDLRTNRPARPTGSRPPPAHFNTWSSRTSNHLTDSPAISPLQRTFTNPIADVEARPSTSHETKSHTRRTSNVSIDGVMAGVGRPLVQPPRGRDVFRRSTDSSRTPSVQYRESQERQAEQEEAHALRIAMEELELAQEEKLFQAARDEAVELVWKHISPNAQEASPHAPYAYPGLAKKGSAQRSRSVEPKEQDLQRANSKLRKRHSMGSAASGSRSSSLQSNGAANSSDPLPPTKENFDSKSKPGESAALAKASADLPDFKQRRRSSGARRTISGSLFQNPNDQIYEEPEEETPIAPAPTPVAAEPPKPEKLPLGVRRNPFMRFQSIKGNPMIRSNTDPVMATKRLDRYEIQKNPPTQSRNAAYTLNPPVLPKPAEDTKSDAENEPELKMKEGKEIRGDDIRAATGFRLRDRSPKLPTPTAVSDAPGRPIVSFKKDWNVVELKEEVDSQSNAASRPLGQAASVPRPLSKAATAPVVPTINFPAEPHKRTTTPSPPSVPGISVSPNPPAPFPKVGRPEKPTISVYEDPPARPLPNASPFRKMNTPHQPTAKSIPTANVYQPSSARSKPASAPSIPAISVSEIPSISVSEASARVNRVNVPSIGVTPPIPRISVNESPAPNRRNHAKAPSISVTPDIPMISVSESPAPARGSKVNAPSISVTPSVPSINVNGAAGFGPATSTRPLPNPKHHIGKSHSYNGTATPRPHWTPTTVRTSALCTQCALPIAGRIVSAGGSRFHPECFACYQCGEHLECVAFYPEPSNKYAERVERIRARLSGQDIAFLPTHPTPSDMQRLEHDDGTDESPRFFCHLDFHELFSPRCKSCKTPIEGEVIVACGAEWHAGHFFCAQCGDPFDSSTPFVEKDGYAWCVNCHTHRFSTKCKGCRKPVTDMVVKALGSEWHAGCFVCVVCTGPFEDGRYFLRGESQDPVCVRCEERRLKA